MTKPSLHNFKLSVHPTIDVHSACCDLWEVSSLLGERLIAEFNGINIDTADGFPNAMADAWLEKRQERDGIITP